MLCYTFSPRSFENIMHHFYNEEEIFFSSRKRRSRTFICLTLLSVAVLVFLITSVVFVTLYCLEQGTHSKPVAGSSSMNASATNQSTQSILGYQSTARPKTACTPTSQKPGEHKVKYCGSKACLFASIGRPKYVSTCRLTWSRPPLMFALLGKFEIVARIYIKLEDVPIFNPN